VLRSAGASRVVDVRSFPGSRRNPQYARSALERSLPDRGIEYVHERALGGFRRPRPDSVNGGWEHAGFRGYADYMASEECQAALKRLVLAASEVPTAVMCAEAQWWRCHRRLIADALVVRGWRVEHLGLGSAPVEHRLTEFAVMAPDGTLTYPPAQGALRL
jgi:uncharacterized protein (DUF488 family)